MDTIKKQLKLDKEQYYETHLSIINCLLPKKMTPMEISVLSRFMSLEGDIAAQRFGTTAKSIVKKSLDISTAGLSNYMKSLTDKGFIKKVNEHDREILPILMPENGMQNYQLQLVNMSSFS